MVIVVASVGGCAHRASAQSYPLHRGIVATVFWVGEPATADNGYVGNDASAWDEQWVEHFGGTDDPRRRQHGGYWPAGFRPRQNPFYLALPYGEFTDSGDLRTDVRKVYWYDRRHPPSPQASILRGRWIAVSRGSRTAYAQWEDVGPFRTDDVDYVFGDRPPADRRAGIDLSPATARYLGVPGSALVSWQFVDSDHVPAGPWTEIVTPSGSSTGS